MVTGRRWRLAHAVGTSVVTLALVGCAFGSTDDTAASTTSSAAASRTALPPWPAPIDDVQALVEDAGLDLGPMGMAEHYHPTLRIVVDGEQVPVSPNIGVDPSTGAMSAVHTHEGDGTIHIEADTAGEVFTLGQLFTQWNVALSEEKIGGIRANNKVTLTVNGRSVPGDPANLRLRPDQQIVLKIT